MKRTEGLIVRVILGAWVLDKKTTNFHADLDLEETINELVTVPLVRICTMSRLKTGFGNCTRIKK